MGKEKKPQSALDKLLESLKIGIVSWIGAIVLWSLYKSWRWKVPDSLHDDSFWEGANPRIFAFWHNRQIAMPGLHKYFKWRPVASLISQHGDGRMIAKAVGRLGLDSVAGSSTRGAAEALRAMARKLEEGSNVAITPDGPKGPIYKMKAGPIHLARLSGAPIYPLAIAAQKSWVFKSWDRMILPRPFTKVVVLIGEPLTVAPDMSEEEVENNVVLLEKRLNELTDKADSYEYD